MRIDAFLADGGVPYEPLPHPPAYSAQKLAKYLRVPGAQVAKAVLLCGPDGYIIAVLPATRQVDTVRLSDALGGPVRLAVAREIAQVFRDCEWGVVPPFGTLYGLTSVLDESLTPDTLLVLEAHTHVQAVRLRCADFERLERPRRLAFGREADGCRND